MWTVQSATAMKLYALTLVLALTATSFSSAIPKPDKEDEDHKNRVFDKELSEEPHFGEEEDHEHNQEYDHEAFLGKDEAKSFDQLTPEESRDRLGKIYDKIDKDHDGKVTETELKDWIKYVQNKYIMEDTDRQWKDHDPEADNTLKWESYQKRTYGFMDQDEENDGDEDDAYSYKDMMRRDERRWQKADRDNDGQLSREEFADFLHPEEAEHMKEIVVDETLEDIDKDKDGFISLEEYIEDMWPSNDRDEEEPDWVKTEREQFSNFRDKNNDGKMDRDEVQHWIIPPEYDHTDAEAKHLIFESDEDKDGILTREEVLEKYDLFVGSQATDFGDALTRHDEF